MVISLCCIFASQGISRENFPMLYWCKDYKNVIKDKKFLQIRFFVCFSGFESFLLKYKNFLSLGLKIFPGQFFSNYLGFISRNIRIFLEKTFFITIVIIMIITIITIIIIIIIIVIIIITIIIIIIIIII